MARQESWQRVHYTYQPFSSKVFTVITRLGEGNLTDVADGSGFGGWEHYSGALDFLIENGYAILTHIAETRTERERATISLSEKGRTLYDRLKNLVKKEIEDITPVLESELERMTTTENPIH